MTYEDLLTQINWVYDNDCTSPSCHNNSDALRAVLKLHKPMQTERYLACSSCEQWGHDGDTPVQYPCPTIQTIERELK